MYIFVLHRLICTEGCNPVRKNKNAIIKMTCTGTDCYEVAWYITDPREPEQWTVSHNNCKSFKTEF